MADENDEPFEWVDNPTYVDEKEDDENDEDSEWSHNPTYSDPSDQEIKINFTEDDSDDNINNIISSPISSSVPSTPKVGVSREFFGFYFYNGNHKKI